MKAIGFLAGFCLLLPVAFSDEAEKVDLKIKYLPGTYTVSTDMETTTVSTGPDGQAQPEQKVKMGMVMKMVMSQLDGGKKKIEIKYEKIKQSLSGPNGALEYDSEGTDDKKPEMFHNLYKNLLNAKLEFVLDEKGGFVEAKGWKELLESMGPAAEFLKDSFGEKALLQMMDQQKALMPSKPVAVGESYENKMSQPVPMLGDLEANYAIKVKSIEGTGDKQIANLEVKVLMEKKNQAATQMGSVKMSFNSVKISQAGEAKFDVAQGLVTSMVIDQEAAFEMAVSGEDGKEVKLSAKSTTRMTTTIKYEAAK